MLKFQVETTEETLNEYSEHLEGLEQKIREAQQRALDQVGLLYQYSVDLNEGLFGIWMEKLCPNVEWFAN